MSKCPIPWDKTFDKEEAYGWATQLIDEFVSVSCS